MIPRGRRLLYLVVTLVLLVALAATARSAGKIDPFPRVPPGHVGLMLRKSGRPLPAGWVVAPRVKPGEEPYQGVQEEVLLPGWYPVYGPFDWEWSYQPQAAIPPDHVGVLVRLFGEDLPDDRVFADEDPEDEARGIVRRGPLKRALDPGIHPINLYAYDVRIFPVRTVESGQVGVVCKRSGARPKDPKTFLSEPGERGVQKQGLAPGTYYLNPLAEEVRVVSRQSLRLDLGSAGRIKFPSNDGFDITLSGTVEWSLKDSEVPLVFVKFGGTEGAEKKLLLPAARAKSRLQGSRKPAAEFISGATRQTFQDEFAKDLRTMAEAEGVRIHSVLISGIVPADEIAKPIREREISLLEREQYQKEMSTERGRIELERQNELRKRPQAMAVATSKSIEVVTQARRNQEVGLIEAAGVLNVARLDLQAARKQAETITETGTAAAEVARLNGEADAEGLRRRVEALGGGAAFARAVLLEKLAPKLTAISTRPEGSMTGLLRDLMRSDGAASRPAGPGPMASGSMGDVR